MLFGLSQPMRSIALNQTHSGQRTKIVVSHVESDLLRFPTNRFFLFALSSLLLLGCGANAKTQVNQSSHLRTLVALYNSASGQLGRAPASEEEFKEFVQSKAMSTLEKMEIANVDDLLVSQRDGQPYVVIYGKRPPGVRRDVIAYEQTGVDGVRQVGFDLGMIEDVPPEEFGELVTKTTQPE